MPDLNTMNAESLLEALVHFSRTAHLNENMPHPFSEKFLLKMSSWFLEKQEELSPKDENGQYLLEFKE